MTLENRKNVTLDMLDFFLNFFRTFILCLFVFFALALVLVPRDFIIFFNNNFDLKKIQF